jgi:YVTN family beta-propeller protein
LLAAKPNGTYAAVVANGAGEDSGAAMRRFLWVRGVLLLGLAGALVGVVPDGVSAVAARKECSATAFATNDRSGTVSTIDVKTRTKHPADIKVGSLPYDLAFTPCRR